MSLFQKRHYEWLADWCRDQSPEVARSLARELERDNGKFKPHLFLRRADADEYDHCPQCGAVIEDECQTCRWAAE
jgi:hypothetical protein